MFRVAPLALLAACSSLPPANFDASVPFDAGASDDAGVVDAGFDAGVSDAGTDAGVITVDAGTDAGATDAGSEQDAGLDAGSRPDAGAWRTSLAACWTDATCNRAMAIGHGGAWGGSVPYDSNAALTAAYTLGLDGVKIDVRVTSDNVPVISHSSPLAIYESVDCYNQRIENMTAAQVVQCHRVPSSTETFQRLDTVLDYLRGKMVVQLCVKEHADIARTIQQVHTSQAEDFAFLEIDTNDLQTRIPAITGSGTVWYLINVASNVSEVDTLLNTINNPRAFMYEFDPTVNVATLVTTRLHPANIRSFTYDNAATLTVQQAKDHFDQGFDVVSANTGPNVLQARQQVNTARGISPP